jgi:hypothetical protein
LKRREITFVLVCKERKRVKGECRPRGGLVDRRKGKEEAKYDAEERAALARRREELGEEGAGWRPRGYFRGS